MSHVLLMRLAGPMQAWGTQSRFLQRDTGTEPSFSGAVGLLCAARGIGRDDSGALARFRTLTMGVRVDREGRFERDYQTVQKTVWDEKSKRFEVKGDAIQTQRFFLADADFLVGFAGGDADFLNELHRALLRPVWQLCLGRKSCPPALPVAAGVREGDLEAVLAAEPWRKRTRFEKIPQSLRYIVQVERGHPEGLQRKDLPLSFASSDRKFDVRFIRIRDGAAPQNILEPDGTPVVEKPSESEPDHVSE